MPASAEVTLPTDSQIQVVRDFAAPRTLVFRAFTRPEMIRRWLLGPPGWTMPVCEIDLKVGGKYRYRWKNDAGNQEFGFAGTFDAIDPEARLVTTERMEGAPADAKARIETSFTDLGQKTRVVYVMDFGTKAARDAAAATGMTDGMETSFKLLDNLLTEPASQRSV